MQANFGRFLLEARPSSSAEPSVNLAEPARFGRATFLAARSFTSRCFLLTQCQNEIFSFLGFFYKIQGDPNQNLLFQLALSLNEGISDPMLIKPKCV